MGIGATSELLIHWMMCSFYLKLTIEGPYILNQAKQSEDLEPQQRLESKLRFLKIANWINVFITVIAGVL